MPQREDHDADQQHPASAEPVGEAAEDQQQRGEDERVRLLHPLHLRRGDAEVVDDRRDRDIDDRGVDDDQRHRDADEDEADPAASMKISRLISLAYLAIYSCEVASRIRAARNLDSAACPSSSMRTASRSSTTSIPRRPRRAAVVQLLHGSASTPGRYGALIDALTADGYTVYADDHRGHGRTGMAQHGGDAAKLGQLGPGGLRAAVGARVAVHRAHPRRESRAAAHPPGPLRGDRSSRRCCSTATPTPTTRWC